MKLEWENNEIQRARVLLAKARERAPSPRVWMKSALLEREQADIARTLQVRCNTRMPGLRHTSCVQTPSACLSSDRPRALVIVNFVPLISLPFPLLFLRCSCWTRALPSTPRSPNFT